MNSLLIGVSALAVAVFIITIVAVALLFEASRLKKVSDTAQRNVDTVNITASNAMSAASQALSVAQSLQVQHFDTLSAKVSGLAGSVASLQAETSSYSESLRNFSLKFDARLKREEKESKKSTLETVVGNEPEGYDPWQPPAQNYNGKGSHLRTLPSTFGQVAQGG